MSQSDVRRTQCSLCESPEGWSGTGLCDSCWEITSRLPSLLAITKTAKGKQLVIDTCINALRELGITKEIALHLQQDLDLGILIERALLRFNRLSPEEQKKERRDQAISFAYGNLRLSGRDITYESIEAAYDKLHKDEP